MIGAEVVDMLAHADGSLLRERGVHARLTLRLLVFLALSTGCWPATEQWLRQLQPAGIRGSTFLWTCKTPT
jgi:hypothetical protein